MEKYVSYVKDLVKQGGPKPEEFSELSNYFRSISQIIKTSENAEYQIQQIREALGEALTENTIQGYGFQKPYGYSGDFGMIDMIYRQHVSPNENYKNWDVFFHAQKAPAAVRNRKQYFLNFITRLRNNQQNKKLHILDIACGSCRDVFEYLDSTNDKNLHFHCVDYDQKAIDYAQELCKNHLNQITFYKRNAFRFRSDIAFDLIWSGGLFDYFTDKQFIYLIKKLYTLLNDNGELIVGNFHPDNPSRDYMEIVGDWYLTYRSEHELLQIARDADFCLNNIRIGIEEEYVNLFLHIKRGYIFL